MKLKIKKINSVLFIKNLMVSVVSRISEFFGDYISLKDSRRYIIAAPILFLFFFICTFPFDIFVRRELKKLEGNTFKSIRADDLSITPFFDWTAKLFSLSTFQLTEISISDIRADIGTIGLLSKNISGDISTGKILIFSDNLKVSGEAKAECDFSIDKVTNLPAMGNIDIDILNLSIQGLSIDGFNIKPVVIPKVKAKLVFSQRTVAIKECVITGKDISGSINGVITLDPVLKRSILNLVIEIDPNSAVLSDFKNMLGMFTNPTTGRLSLSIQGPISDPKKSFIKENAPSAIAPSFKKPKTAE